MLPKQVMVYKMEYWLSRVKGEQDRARKAADDANRANAERGITDLVLPAPNHQLIERALDKACEAAVVAAPYYHNRLAAFTHTVRHDITKLTDEELANLIAIAERLSRESAGILSDGADERGSAALN
jgi:hypothetical protein